MKKIFLTTVILSSLFFNSCSNENDINEINSVEQDSSLSYKINSNSYFNDYNFDIIGEEHNKGLENIYLALETIDLNNDGTNEIFETSKHFLLENKNFKNLDENLLDNLEPDTSSNNLIFDLESELNSNISSDYLKIVIDDIKDVFNNYKTIENYSSDSVITELRIIENNIIDSKNIFNDKEYVAVRSVISTSIHSLKYWEVNIDKWNNLMNDNQTSGRGWGWFKETIGDMAVADAYGAGVGAVVGFVSSVATGPGVLVGTAAGAVGYGMNASALQGIRSLFS